MKLIIFEGGDRTGKNSYISELAKGLPSYTIRHWSFPEGRDDEEKEYWQKKSFLEEFAHFAHSHIHIRKHVFFWNRSHIGELVYGKIYRESHPEDWVIPLEELFRFGENPDIYLIHLRADAEFLVKQDDGKSYSNELSKKQKEVAAFDAAVSLSTIKNKLIVNVNNSNLEYNDFTQIANRIREFVGL